MMLVPAGLSAPRRIARNTQDARERTTCAFGKWLEGIALWQGELVIPTIGKPSSMALLVAGVAGASGR